MLIGDYAGGVMVVVGVLSALVDRERHGRGAFIDVSMLDAAVSWTSSHMTGPFAAAVQPGAEGSIAGWGDNPRYSLYRTRDGKYVTVSLLEKKYWDAFCRLHGREDLINPHETEADRLTTHGARGEAYRRFLEDVFATKDRDVWAEQMRIADIPVCAVLTPAELPHTAQAASRQQFMSVACPSLGLEVPQLGFPFRMTTSDGSNAFALRHCPPALGEGNDDLLRTFERSTSVVIP
jgi:crotonobetainyl-CoA:carnitine CoA-transferase CaiB-like acyl-CoA transferase